MFHKGRKLVDLVKQNDENKQPQDVVSSACNQKVPAKTNLPKIMQSKRKVTPAADDDQPQQKNLIAEEKSENAEKSSTSTSKHTGIASTPLLPATTNIHESISSSKSGQSNVKRRLFSPHQDLTIVVTSEAEKVMEVNSDSTPSAETSSTNNVVTTEPKIYESLGNITNSPSLLSQDILVEEELTQSPITVAKANEPDQTLVKPGTSKETQADTLRQDLYLSDSSTSISNNPLSPYIDSESSYCPSPPSRSCPPLNMDSELSDTAEVANENQPKRRKKAMPETWKRNTYKKLRQSGKGYTNRKGKAMEPKACKPTDCSKCRYKCNLMFPENLRKDIFNEYWTLGNAQAQKVILSGLITHGQVLRVYTLAIKNRTMSRQYWLFHESVGRHRVCQKIFCNTFNISSSIINNCSKNRGLNGSYICVDKRKGKLPPNITSVVATNFVKEHIDEFPRIESHYCRKDSKKQYLDSDLNLSRMYRMYKDEFCPKKQIMPVSPYVYQRIFHSYEPKLSFYKPKKDQCTKCNVYKRSDDRASLVEEYELHKKREQDSLKMKREDKDRCLNTNGAFRAITFDLQAILSVPFTGDCKIYYLRKLSLYNFTILDCHENTGHCYLWDGCNGKKGSTEIASILLKYLYTLPENVKHVASFSDTCGGQNRNKYVTLTALYAVNNIPHLETIDLKFMESGHSYLEADSMHACIERARKHKSIFTSREYALIIGSARIKPKPYDVITMKHVEFYDIKSFEKTLNTNTTKNIKNETVQWLKIKWLRVNKDSPTSIFYKYDLYDSDFEEINICKAKVPAKRREFLNKLKRPLKKAYKSPIPISQCKKKDLLTLLKDGVIPSDYEQYYRDLPSTAAEIANLNGTDTETPEDEDGDQDEDCTIEEI